MGSFSDLLYSKHRIVWGAIVYPRVMYAPDPLQISPSIQSYSVTHLVPTILGKRNQSSVFYENHEKYFLKNFFKITCVAVLTIFLVALPQRDKAPRVVGHS